MMTKRFSAEKLISIASNHIESIVTVRAKIKATVTRAINCLYCYDENFYIWLLQIFYFGLFSSCQSSVNLGYISGQS